MAITRLGGANAISGTLPAANINDTSIGNITSLPAGVGGKVLQVVSTNKSDATNTTSTSYTDISGMSVSITPSSSSNKILVFFDVGIGSTQTARNDNIRLMRDSTAIADPTNFMRTTNVGLMYNASANFLDSPSSTSSLAYHLEWKTEGGDTIYLNRKGETTIRTTSTITVMEIAG